MVPSSRDRNGWVTTPSSSRANLACMPVAGLEPEHLVDVQTEPTGVVLTIQGCLDMRTGEALVHAAARAVAEEASRVDIDLCSITGFTEVGACALIECRELCAGLPEGLHYRTGQGPGREALLAAYADC